MNNLDKSLQALEELMNQLSDENLDNLIGEINAKGITGPSVDEYFGSLNHAISAFLADPVYSVNPEVLAPVNSAVVACAGAKVNHAFSFANLAVIQTAVADTKAPYGYVLAGELVMASAKVVAGENTYAMAA